MLSKIRDIQVDGRGKNNSKIKYAIQSLLKITYIHYYRIIIINRFTAILYKNTKYKYCLNNVYFRIKLHNMKSVLNTIYFN